MPFKHADLVVFQLLNWSGALLLFIVFARFEDQHIFASIGKAEVMVGCIGAFLMSASLWRQPGGVSKQGEKPLLLVRLGTVATAVAGSMLGWWSEVYIFAAMSTAAIPAHIPLLLGYRSIIYILLTLRHIVAGMAFVLSGFNVNLVLLAAIYFAPNILYGLGCYAYYWRLLPDSMPGQASLHSGNRQSGSLALHFLTICACNIAQSNIVFQIIKNSWELAVVERLLRSAYSFMFPYTVRLKFWSRNMTVACACVVLGFLLLAASGIIGESVKSLLIGPVLLDIFSSAVAGKYLILDIVVIMVLTVSGLLIEW